MMKYLDQNNNKRLHWRLGPVWNIIIFVENVKDHTRRGLGQCVVDMGDGLRLDSWPIK